jgi:TM2 domain-containing membrane protein YozV
MRWIIAALLVLVSVQSTLSQTQSCVDRLAVQRDLFGANGLRVSQPSLAVEDVTSSAKKNVGLAVLYSLFLPGMGELYVGDYGTGKYFTIGEGVLWLTYASFEVYGDWLRDDARLFATTHAGVDPSGKDDQYYVDIGNYINTYEYNEKKLRDRESGKLYDLASSYFWKWDSDASRANYRDMRVSHDHVFNNAKFVAAAIIVNHVASAINAGRLAIAHNSEVEEAGSIGVHASVIGGFARPDGIMITMTKRF